MDRRHFLKRSLVRGTLVATGLAASGELLAARPERLTRPGARRPLGKTGEQLSVLGFGGIVVMSVEQSFANNIVAEAVDRDAHAKRAWGTWRLRPSPRASIRRASLPEAQHTPKCWYEPCKLPEEASLALRWTLSQPYVTAAIPPGNPEWFRRAMDVAQSFQPITEEENRALLAQYPVSSFKLQRFHRSGPNARREPKTKLDTG